MKQLQIIRGKDQHSKRVEDIQLFYKSMHTSCKPKELGFASLAINTIQEQ